MKTLTKAERRKIYLEVADSFKRGFLCFAIGRATDVSVTPESFPEFYSFHPTPEEREGFAAWWFLKNVEVRIICMLLCAEMTKTENL